MVVNGWSEKVGVTWAEFCALMLWYHNFRTSPSPSLERREFGSEGITADEPLWTPFQILQPNMMGLMSFCLV